MPPYHCVVCGKQTPHTIINSHGERIERCDICGHEN